jgi:ATP-binding cassette subfamily C protein
MDAIVATEAVGAPVESATTRPDKELRGFLTALLGLLRWRLVGIVVLTLLSGLVSGLSVVALLPMLQLLGLEVAGGPGERLSSGIVAIMRLAHLEPSLSGVLSLHALLVILTALLSRFQSILSVGLNQTAVQQLRMRLYRGIARAEWLHIAGKSAGHFNHVLLAELDRVGAAIGVVVSLLVSSARAVSYAAIAVTLSSLMTGLTLVLGLILLLLLKRRTEQGRAAGRGVSAAYADLYAAAGEHLAGLKFTKSHALESRQSELFDGISRRVARAHVAVVRNQADVAFWLQAGTVIALSLSIYGALQLLALPSATVLLLVYLFTRLMPLVSGLQRQYQVLLSLLPAYGQFASTLEEAESASESDLDDARPLELGSGIELRGVSFRYPTSSQPVIERLDLSIPVGQTTALVGPSGGGKSTIADLVLGLLTPLSGDVLIDGEPLTPRRRRTWRGKVAYVSQDGFLLNDTIRANLLSVRQDADDEELWEALTDASADFAARLPQGLETEVGDRGVRLSGGERQRIVLARALLRRPSLLILDEATSSLDNENEERIKEAIDRLSGRMTLLVIAHRLATIRTAHAIHVLEEGRLVESGSWDELMRKAGGRLRALVESQGELVRR